MYYVSVKFRLSAGDVITSRQKIDVIPFLSQIMLKMAQKNLQKKNDEAILALHADHGENCLPVMSFQHLPQIMFALTYINILKIPCTSPT